MKNYLIGASLLAGSFAAPALAEDFYLSIGGTQQFVHEIEGDTTISGTSYNLSADIENAFGYDIEFGKQFNENWRLGLAYSHTEPKQENVTATTGGSGVTASISPKPTYDVGSLMLNVYRDFPRDGKFAPYVGLGLGSTSIELQTYTTTVAGTDVTVTDDGRSVFSWDVKAGVTYELSDRTDLYGEIAYGQTSSFDEDGINYDGIKNTNLGLGVKWNF
jgi:opacity protein-like surface antigen